MLKNSARNCARRRSPKCQFLASEKSRFLKPESGKIFRRMVPKVPSAGGIITELPLAKHPQVVSDARSPGVVAFDTQELFVVPVKYGIDCGPDLKSDGLPKKS